MQKQVSCKYSVPLARKIGKQYWWRQQGSSYAFYIGVPLITLLLCFASGEFSIKGTSGFIIGFLAGVISVFVFFLVSSYLDIEKTIAATYEEWKDETVTHQLNEDGVTTNSKNGHAHLSWRAFKSLWQMPDAFILFQDEDNYLLFPVTALDEEAKQFLVHKVAECGGSITR